ncbi:glycosyltransferase [Synechococcus sp. CS-1330]|jgi:O-antigen biosynthesis protein|nr:glycosyltransferase [Synechococcus sp. CS-1330]
MTVSVFGPSPRELLRRLKRGLKLRVLGAGRPMATPPQGCSGDPQGDANRSLAAASQLALNAFLASPAKLHLGAKGDGPLVSLVLVLFNKAHLTYACLQHLQQLQHTNLDVLIVDNNSNDQTPELLSRLEGRVKVLRQSENLHFLRACNLAFAQLDPEARYVALVNNDALLDAAIINHALQVFDRWPGTGIVGGQILHLDGQLQEAGSLICRDGSCRGLGRRQSPWQPLVHTRRRVDYVSGCFLVIQSALLRQLGGFDPRFAPAYYEETDLCVGSWKLGRPVVYEPRCLVHHVEFASASQASGQGRKAAELLMQTNQRHFRDKHANWLQEQPPAQAFQDLPAVEQACRLQAHPIRLLWVDDKLPNPAQGAGFGRLETLIRTLADRGCFVTLFATDLAETGTPPDLSCHSLNADYELHWGGADALNQLLDTRKSFYTHVVASRRHNQELLLEWLRTHPTKPTQPLLIADVESVFSIREQSRNHLQRTQQIATAAELLSSKSLTAELAALKGFDQVWAVSQLEADLLAEHTGSDVHLVGHAFASPAQPPSYTNTAGLLFMGAMNYPGLPNLDSLAWLADAVLPALRQQPHLNPEQAPLTIIGPYRGSLVQPLLDRLQTVWPTIHLGPVAQVEPVLRSHRLLLAPTRFAAGLPHKVQHGISMGVPVITTELIASQMGWSNGEGLLASNNAIEFARLIAQLYSDPGLWQQVQAGGLARIRRDCDPLRLQSAMANSLGMSSNNLT